MNAQTYCRACRIEHPSFAIFKPQIWSVIDSIPISPDCLLYPLAEATFSKLPSQTIAERQEYLAHVFEAQRRFGE